jgi:polyisoprenoid-binding protein YceI
MHLRSIYKRSLWWLLLLSCLAFATPASIETQKSTLTVRVYKSGFFSAFAHDHEINAPIDSGSFSEETPSVEISVTAGKLKVVDKESSESERAKIQEKMLSPDVLNAEKFKEIHFRSTKVEAAGQGSWLVTGDLTLHGQTHPVSFKVTKSGAHYQGSAEVKQKDFGMTPISIAGGSVKVKDQVKIEFDVVGQ